MTRPAAHIVGRSVDGRPILVERFGDTGPVCLVVCGIHGNEASSVTFGERLRSRLRTGWAARRGIRVDLLQIANPDGVDAGTRTNARDVDINRNFPASNYQAGGVAGADPESEPETRALRRLVDDLEPDALLAIHCCEPLFDWDGPARPLAEAMAAAMPDEIRFPVEKLGANPGSLGSWAGVDREIPVVTVEFDCHGPTDIRDQLDALERSVDAAFANLADATPSDPTRAETNRAPATPHSPEVHPGDRDAPFGSCRRRYGAQTFRIDRRAAREHGAPLLLVDGAAERPARYVFESLRRQLLHRRRLGRPVVVASVVSTSAGEAPQSQTAAEPLEQLLADFDPSAIVAVASGERDGFSQDGLQQFPFADRAGDLAELDPTDSGVVRDADVPTLHFAVSSDHAEGRGAEQIPSPGRYGQLLDLVAGTAP